MGRVRWIAAAVVLTGLGAPVAMAWAEDDPAVGAGYGSENLTFERWCQEIQKYPQERCAAKASSDVAAYNDTKSRLQTIEVDHDKDRRQDRQFRKELDAHNKLTPLNKL